MGAQVIDFAGAARRVRARAPMTPAERFYHELETEWPAAFQRAVRPHLDFELDPRTMPNQVDYGVGQLLERRNGEGMGWATCQLVWNPARIRGCAARLHEERAKGGRLVKHYARQLKGEKRKVLCLLFDFGWRRVRHPDVEQCARFEVAEQCRGLREQAADYRARAASRRARLATGTTKAGKPLAERTIRNLRHGPDGLEAALRWQHEYEEKLAALERESDPMRAFGFFRGCR